ncbi:hypothetical protein [Flagellimonas pacifica]|uniref:hypothetical protein n=1 Tax=Flagellimonas pacifica TaxID=1247520 RepID=UPI0010568C8D|nr:hypothetical protein [Allomuricauda parva]
MYDKYEGMSSEKIYVGVNTTLLFTGEYLYYTVFCLDDKTKQPSKISSYAYLQLISNDGTVIFQHKVSLINSRGQGDFFVPTSISSGVYKLIGYTKWMRNGRTELFFQDDISIINPYQSNQTRILKDKSSSIVQNSITASGLKIQQDKRFVLEADKNTYPKRTKVNLKLKNFRGPSGYGNYSLSVRRKSEFPNKFVDQNPISFIESHSRATANELPKYFNIEYLPETLGERISGKIVPRTEGTSVENKIVGISIPGTDFQLKAAVTDSEGEFHVDIFQNYTKPVIIAQMLEEGDKDAFKVELIHDPPLNLDNLKFKEFSMDSTMESAILERSVSNQIENAYYQARPDTLEIKERNDPYGGGEIERYDLDDFTRFPTLIETMVEILPYASIRKQGKDNFIFNVRLFDNYEGPQRSALVFIDGMLITSHKRIVEFDSKTISHISVVREKFELAGKNYRGMINIETFDKNYFEETSMENIAYLEIMPPVKKKKYYHQSYSQEEKEKYKRHPDNRYQLLWNPNVKLQGSEKSFDFYTSDIPGIYEITLEGFSIFGRPVFVSQTIEVR